MSFRNFFRISLMVVSVLFLTASCVKEGPMGLAGADGVDGKDGKDGKDGTAGCLVCHNTTTKSAVIAQYNTSQHAAGAATARSTSNQCSVCHSHEGFLEHVQTGRDTTYAGVAHPTNIGCATCHSTHNTFNFTKDGQDYALRTVAAVDLMLYPDQTTKIDFGNTSNLCANCHQPRNSYQVPGAAGETTLSIISSRYGPHHGPQSTLVEGIGLYEIAGSTPIPGTKSHPHRAGSCVSCHMGDFKVSEGGHTWKPSVDNCKTCHTSATSFDVNGGKTRVEGLIASLKSALVAKGVIDATGALTKPGGKTISATNPLVLPIAQAGAYWNYINLIEDRSNGIHNPKYIEAVLKNSIEALQ